MHRVLTDDGGWFDLDAAQSWDEDTFTDAIGNKVSCATRSQYTHERLYRTRNGAWVVNGWRNGHPHDETYTVVTPAYALRWLITNSEEVPSYLEAIAAETEV